MESRELIVPLHESLSWQETLTNTVNDIDQLLSLLGLSREDMPVHLQSLTDFPLKVPLPYLNRIERKNPEDPLFLQIFPSYLEGESLAGYTKDPLEEAQFNVRSGMLHKYSGRVLFIATACCAIHCRYCFRRHFPYSDNRPGKQLWQEALAYIRNDKSINEVILSGGDPLTLPDNYLGWFYQQISAIKHINRIRIHTRLPIMIPQRITSSLLEILANPELQTILVLHSNHAQELDHDVMQACHSLHDCGVMLLNQSVLLKNINDSAIALAELSEKLCQARVMPYYLHLLDKVQAAGHFDVSEDNAVELMKDLQNHLPGFLVPKLVRETAGETHKTVIPIV